ncbi:MAG: hypothetical protein RLZZ244_407, partial [Verrucomicrobiota bacterium]
MRIPSAAWSSCVWLLLPSTLLLPACRKAPEAALPSEVAAQREQELAEREAALLRREEEQRLVEERRALERDRDAFVAEQAQYLEAKEKADSQEVAELQKKAEAAEAKAAQIQRREEELFAREVQAASKEKQLDAKSLELAGRQMLPPRAIPVEPVPKASAPTADYGLFYDGLAGHGRWFETPEYGWVWQPRVGQWSEDWRPYTRGRWVCSDLGWTWISEEPFGWACYHYGRWAKLRSRGWVWIPGDEWAPAWVVWNESGGYVGWAPLPPETLVYRGEAWRKVNVTHISVSINWFTFVEVRNFCRPPHTHCLPLERNRELYVRGSRCGGVFTHGLRVGIGGPGYRALREASGGTLPFVSVRPDHTLGAERSSGWRLNQGEVRFYAPEVRAPWNPLLQPKHVFGRWDDAHLDHEPDEAHRVAHQQFRQMRQTQTQEAQGAVTSMGRQGEWLQRKTELLRDNRREAEVRERSLGVRPSPTQPVPAVSQVEGGTQRGVGGREGTRERRVGTEPVVVTPPVPVGGTTGGAAVVEGGTQRVVGGRERTRERRVGTEPVAVAPPVAVGGTTGGATVVEGGTQRVVGGRDLGSPVAGSVPQPPSRTDRLALPGTNLPAPVADGNRPLQGDLERQRAHQEMAAKAAEQKHAQEALDRQRAQQEMAAKAAEQKHAQEALDRQRAQQEMAAK